VKGRLDVVLGGKLGVGLTVKGPLLAKAARKGAPRNPTSASRAGTVVEARGMSAARQIPRPAGENAGLRDDARGGGKDRSTSRTQR